MKPDKKYMNIQYNDELDYDFMPLKNTFNFRCNNSSLTPFFKVNNSIFADDYNNFDYNFRNDTESSNLFPDETMESQLYCYTNQLEKDTNYKNNMTLENDNDINDLTPDKILREFDLDLDENEDLDRVRPDNKVNRIFFKIQRNNPNILNTFLRYGIPYPIAKIMIKRIIKLSLRYYKER
ncbi:hypothetical protein [Clostridium taeniosporum]|uniref:Uncharacterized protein n=1 Tax=Clostridium taeniosporum TaxID=394958 RepID=A0A1D7XID4_9CLOT|nr:hypothetical protein [Clostridium taeniosporum]AOR22859.1 hypothetical protein BGI42_03640 [Clostridium taeniosporum]